MIDYLNVSRKSVQLVFIFNCESKNISTCTVQRELWGLGLNQLSVTLIGKQKVFSLLGSIKIELWINGKRSCGSMSPDLSSSRMKVHQDKKRVR